MSNAELRRKLKVEAKKAHKWADHYNTEDGTAKSSCYRGEAIAYQTVLRWLKP